MPLQQNPSTIDNSFCLIDRADSGNIWSRQALSEAISLTPQERPSLSDAISLTPQERPSVSDAINSYNQGWGSGNQVSGSIVRDLFTPGQADALNSRGEDFSEIRKQVDGLIDSYEELKKENKQLKSDLKRLREEVRFLMET